MKKLLLLIFSAILICLHVSAQEVTRFQILEIKKIKNNCFKLTADNNGKKYIIYSHYDGVNNNGEYIHCNEYLDLKIIPLLETKHVTMAEIKEKMGMQYTTEDESCFVDVSFPLNHKSMIIDYYGNKVKISQKKMSYHALNINGIQRKKE